MTDLPVQGGRGTSFHIGVDVGSTFTDLVYFDPTTQGLHVRKHLTTPDRLTGVIEALDASITGNEGFSRADYFFHATTIGINTLLERTGAKIGMLVTAGFRDFLELRRGTREDERGHRVYDLMWKAPPALVPRWLRQPIHERVAHNGTVVVPVEPVDVQAACEVFRANGVTSVAVAFFNAYANPENEILAAAALREAGFTGEISLSHALSREIFEYERASTTVVDACVRPRISSYLHDLEEALRARGFTGNCLIMRSGGGVVSFAEAAARPFETIMSGPVAGAVAAGHLARAHGIERAVAADVGGTSFDTCMLIDGSPNLLYKSVILGNPVQAQCVGIRSIGAGGGSIAREERGLLRVGPQSAGANPGPACYGRGGTLPTVTDAAATLGMLGDGRLAGGILLNLDLARRALSELGEALGSEADVAAQGVIAVLVAAMAAAIRSVTVEVGEDPRHMALIAYGGAGPLFACQLARELGMAYTLVPMYAGNFSACGLLMQELTRSASQTTLMPLSPGALAASNQILTGLFAHIARPPSYSPGGERPAESETWQVAADLRYLGQMYALTIDVPCQPNGEIAPEVGIEDLRRVFESTYSRQFGHALESPIEIVALRALIRTPTPRIALHDANAPVNSLPMQGSIQAFSVTAQQRLAFAVIDRLALRSGDTIPGPAIIREPTATTYLDKGFEAIVLSDQTLQLREEGKL